MKRETNKHLYYSEIKKKKAITVEDRDKKLKQIKLYFFKKLK